MQEPTQVLIAAIGNIHRIMPFVHGLWIIILSANAANPENMRILVTHSPH